MQTPTTTLATRYSTEYASNAGIGECDQPFSIKYVMIFYI